MTEKFGPGPFDDYLDHPTKMIVRTYRKDTGEVTKALADLDFSILDRAEIYYSESGMTT